MDVAKADENLKVCADYNANSITFYDVKKSPFRIYGAIETEGKDFIRLPSKIAGNISEAVLWLSKHTAGIRVRFTTNSSNLVLKVKTPPFSPMPHMAICGQSGFDVYIDCDGKSNFLKTFMPPYTFENGYIAKIELPNNGMTSYTLNFPLYHAVDDLQIGIDNTAKIVAGEEYSNELPILYYGSSITQGGCASRPGNSYQSIIARKLNRDHINLGFSGNALGESAMAEYIAKQQMSAFVMDYDHNAPNAKHLEDTHFKFYSIIRNTQPKLPIVLVSKPGFSEDEPEDFDRYQVILNTYQKAIEHGDDRIAFVEGKTLFDAEDKDCSTVDGSHPNDFGFVFMARKISRALIKLEI